MEMREKLKEAIGSVPMWDGDTFAHNHTREELYAAVDAVLAAMREPDEAMKKAARDAPLPLVQIDSFSGQRDLVFTAKWQAAIDAAMSPPSDWIPGGMVVPDRLEE